MIVERSMFKKGRHCFDTTQRPTHVTFDDGRRKRNLPWMHYVEARWDSDEPETVYVTIGNWLVVIVGHNIGPLYTAIEEHTLSRVRAHPEYSDDAAHADDSFAVEIRFLKAPESGKRGQTELDLGLT